jgi:DNA-directed RNA polymerase specialized sigma24 family protein
MPLRRKEVFIHVRDLGMTYEEAAEALGISPRTVEVQLRIVRDYFLKALEHAGVVVTDGTMRKLLPPKTGASDE